MKEPRGQELINRYRRNYKIAADAVVTEAMVLTHWDLERRLTRELLTSKPADRWQVFERCYSTLYTELAWLNESVDSRLQSPPNQRYANWLDVIGSSPRRIYEIGSGKAELISWLATLGHDCKATEITRERGGKHAAGAANLAWGVSDGVHLDRFEERESYDIVISNQVVEHLHPDDLIDHFAGVKAILAPGGSYILSTPHAWYGPWDISKVFKRAAPLGMHLQEYTYRELRDALRAAGFADIRAIMKRENEVNSKQRPFATASCRYLRYQCLVELALSRVPRTIFQRRLTKACQAIGFSSDIFLMARQGSARS